VKSPCIVFFFDLSALTYTRGHKYKLYKKQSSINAYKYFFSNRTCDIWNALPNFVFDVSSSNNFRRLFDKVSLYQLSVLLWLFIVIILLVVCISGYMPFMSSEYVHVLCSYRSTPVNPPNSLIRQICTENEFIPMLKPLVNQPNYTTAVIISC